MQSKIQNTFELIEGEIQAWKVFPNGEKELVFCRKNLITKEARLAVLASLWDQEFRADRVTTFKLGLGGTIDPDGRFPRAEDPLQTDLVNPVISVKTSYVVDSENVKVTFLADLSPAEGNGLKITEAGLFKVSGKIFNVKNFPAVPKSSEFGLHFEWSIRVN